MTDLNDRSVDRYLASLDDEQTVKDSETLIEMMQRISGREPTLWNVGTIGFDEGPLRDAQGTSSEVGGRGIYRDRNPPDLENSRLAGIQRSTNDPSASRHPM